jgi:hypothetical protein
LRLLFGKLDSLLYDQETDINNCNNQNQLDIKDEVLDNLDMDSIKKLFKVFI